MPLSLDGIRIGESSEASASSALPAEHRAEPEQFGRLLRHLAREIDRGEAIVTAGAHAGYAQRDAAELIALQAGIYRYSEAVDLTVKLVDRAATATKTILESGR
jgi:hypothetical protein